MFCACISDGDTANMNSTLFSKFRLKRATLKSQMLIVR